MRLGPWGLSNLPKVTGANQEQSPALDFATQDDPRVSSPQGQDGVPDGPLLPQSDGPLTASPWGLGHTRRSLASADSLAALQVGLLASRPHGPDTPAPPAGTARHLEQTGLTAGPTPPAAHLEAQSGQPQGLGTEAAEEQGGLQGHRCRLPKALISVHMHGMQAVESAPTLPTASGRRLTHRSSRAPGPGPHRQPGTRGTRRGDEGCPDCFLLRRTPSGCCHPRHTQRPGRAPSAGSCPEQAGAECRLPSDGRSPGRSGWLARPHLRFWPQRPSQPSPRLQAVVRGSLTHHPRTHLEVLLGKKPKATGAAQATGGQCAQRPLQGRKRPAPHLEAPSPPSPAPPSLASLGIPRSGSAPGAPRGRPPALPDSSLLARTHVLAEAAPHRKQARTDRTGGARAEGPARAPRLRPHPTRRAGVSGGLSSLAAWPHPPGPRAPGPPLTDGAGAWKRLPPGLTTPLPTECGGGGGAHSQPHPPPPAFLARPLPGALPQPRSLTLGLSPSQQEAQPGRRAESNWPRWRAAPNLGGATLGSRRPPAPGCAPLGGKTEHQRAETQASPAQSGWAPHLFSKHFAERIKGHCTGSRVPDGSGGAGFAEAGTYRATLLSPSS
uniref:Uncharacterized protein n=1 Tax=Rangifer tarandus platyrhynchus TaxID=3082113 RepID=A0ACB0E549_RANTA|nr:unnamed protein product [Rangifer tarandus platyrhynchus]